MRKLVGLIVGTLMSTSLAVFPLTSATATESVDCALDSVGIVIRGTIGADTLTGTLSDDVICGDAGNDTITTGGGDDTVYGGAGIDYINGLPEDCKDPIASDVIVGTESDDRITGTDDIDIICALGGDDTIFGLGGNDIIYAGSGTDSVSGGAGDDYIDFGVGNDIGFGGPGGDKLFGGNGIDALSAEDGSDLVDGGEGNDTMNGDGGDDRLTGGEGNDTIVGGAGGDSMVGGAGVDVFTGGDGVDYCVRDSGESGKSCFFDNAKPKILEVSSSVNSVSVAEGDDYATVNVFVTTSDAGVGVRAGRLGINLIFASANFVGGETGTSFSNEPCLTTDGDIWAGTWVCAVRIPSEALGQVARLFSLSVTDGVGNRAVKVVERNLFTIVNDQFGTKESVRPTISDFTVSTVARTFDVTNSPKFIEGQFRAADASGVYRVELGSLRSGVQQILCDESGFDTLATELKANAVASIQTDNSMYDPLVPDLINHIRTSQGGGGILCRVSGDAESGLYKFIYQAPRFPSTSALQLTARAIDYSGNASKSNPVIDATVVNSLVDFSDNAAPTIEDVAVTPTIINTSTNSAIVTIRAEFLDAGNGLESATLEFVRPATKTRDQASFNVLVRYERCVVTGVSPDELRNAATPVAGVNITPSTSCLLSGDHRNGAFEAKVLIPANFPNGTFTLSAVRTIDNVTGKIRDVNKKTLARAGLALAVRNG